MTPEGFEPYIVGAKDRCPSQLDDGADLLDAEVLGHPHEDHDADDGAGGECESFEERVTRTVHRGCCRFHVTNSYYRVRNETKQSELRIRTSSPPLHIEAYV